MRNRNGIGTIVVAACVFFDVFIIKYQKSRQAPNRFPGCYPARINYDGVPNPGRLDKGESIFISDSSKGKLKK